MQVKNSIFSFIYPAANSTCYWMVLAILVSLNIFSCTNGSIEANRYWEIYEYESYSQDSSIGLSLSYPQFSFENEIARSFLDSLVKNNRIGTTYTIGALSNMTYDKLSIDDDNVQSSHVIVKDVSPAIIGKNLLELTIYSYEFAGGAHGWWGYDFIIVDLESIETVALDHFISPVYYSTLVELGIDNFKRDHDIDPSDKLTEHFWFKNSMYSNLYLPNEFFVDEEGINFFYQIYEIAPFAQGNVVLNYSWSDLEDVMDKTLYNRLTRNRKTVNESDIGRTPRHYHSPIDKFLQSYFDCFISKDILAKCNGEYYADKLIKFHDHSNITRETANKLDKQDFTKNEISSYEIRFPSEKSINVYRNFTVVKRLPLDYVITKKNGRKINYSTELDIVLQNNPLKIIAIGKDVDLSDLVDTPDLITDEESNRIEVDDNSKTHSVKSLSTSNQDFLNQISGQTYNCIEASKGDQYLNDCKFIYTFDNNVITLQNSNFEGWSHQEPFKIITVFNTEELNEIFARNHGLMVAGGHILLEESQESYWLIVLYDGKLMLTSDKDNITHILEPMQYNSKGTKDDYSGTYVGYKENLKIEISILSDNSFYCQLSQTYFNSDVTTPIGSWSGQRIGNKLNFNGNTEQVINSAVINNDLIIMNMWTDLYGDNYFELYRQ